jgi:hypothetical protein
MEFGSVFTLPAPLKFTDNNDLDERARRPDSAILFIFPQIS